jgi:hypothetical protein
MRKIVNENTYNSTCSVLFLKSLIDVPVTSVVDPDPHYFWSAGSRAKRPTKRKK